MPRDLGALEQAVIAAQGQSAQNLERRRDIPLVLCHHRRQCAGQALAGVVIGCGGIGSQIALRAWAFGMNIICVDPEDIPFSPFITKTVKPDQLDEVVPQADVVFISAPHTEKSHKMMGPKQFDLMKKGSYFIAVSRGRLYDTAALVKALDSRKLAGAGLDVFENEPDLVDPNVKGLLAHPNVIATAHAAGSSQEGLQRTNKIAAQTVIDLLNGRSIDPSCLVV